jgi:hypothetical protein
MFTVKSCLSTFAASLSILAAAPASASFFAGNTTGDPAFNRPLSDFSALSSVGTAVPYDVFSFSVDTSGLYTFLSVAAKDSTGVRWDNFLLLYQGSFDPAHATANGVVGNDDAKSVGFSAFSDVSLSTGTAYYLVTTGYSNTSSGQFVDFISGPGNIIAVVPEPETYAMLALGLLVVGLKAGRRTRAVTSA